jgi:hypothetical protein
VNGTWEIDSGCWGCGANLVGLCITCQDAEADRLWAAILPPAEMALRRLFRAAYTGISAAEREALLNLRLSPSEHAARFDLPYDVIRTARAGGRVRPGEAVQISLTLRRKPVDSAAWRTA